VPRWISIIVFSTAHPRPKAAMQQEFQLLP
jgi:hypothetical protein